MEVVTATPNGGGTGLPFRNHDVHEWSHLDSLTGVLERARLETDHWSAKTNNSSHKYNKVVDSRARSQVDGVQVEARRQFEVFQSSVPGGRLQVVKSHTVSSSRFSSKGSAITNGSSSAISPHFADLELTLNPLDLSFQKSKVSVGRSVGRRPPSRPRVREEQFAANHRAETNLYRVSRLCHQIHENAVQQAFGGRASPRKLPIHERENGDGIEIVELETIPAPSSKFERGKSTSSDDLQLTPEKDNKTRKSIEDLEDLEQLQNWRRTSKLRRSLQHSRAHCSPVKLADLPDNKGSVKRIKEDLETGRRLNTALRGNNVDLKALDEILQSISNSSSDTRSDSDYGTVRKPKRNSFVTVESLKEVRERLRRTNSPEEDHYPQQQQPLVEEADDGIVTDPVLKHNADDLPPSDIAQSRVRSYVYGIETMMNRKQPVMGTGSLESRSKQLNGNCTFRNEDWYNRRKSYGFEKVHNGAAEPSNITSSTRNRIESSTDSGICRSSEVIVVPTNNKSESNHYRNGSSIGNVQRYTSIFEGRSNPDGSQHGDRKDFGPGTTVHIPITTHVDTKRHSMSAMDDTNHVDNSLNDQFQRTHLSEQYCDSMENDRNGRKQKRVEFCKTEVHFAAESGKVNIVATDEKPPPTNNFRRRRKHHNQVLKNMNKPGMPVLHFGDSSYEKSLFAINDQENDTNEPNFEEDSTPANNVTVSTNQGGADYAPTLLEDLKETESEYRKGILKNKPVKPKPYLLGDDNFFNAKNADPPEDIWGVKLKPVRAEPMWKSTVTLKNTLYDKRVDDYDTNSLEASRRRPENNRGYSTKVNIGGDEDVVVDCEKRTTPWATHEESPKDAKKHILNKGLIVRIGRDETNSQHTLYTKTTMNNTTTTKITIDLSPSPTNQLKAGLSRLPSAHNFKSTSLILNTFKNESENASRGVGRLSSKTISQQLEVLKKLYEDWQSDTEADKEVQSLMNIPTTDTVDDSSIISGSWSKMRALKTMQQQLAKNISSSYVNSHARVEKDSLLSRVSDPVENIYTEIRDRDKTKDIVYAPAQHHTDNLSTSYRNEKLSSPFRVQKSPPRSPSPLRRSPLRSPSRVRKVLEQRRSPQREHKLNMSYKAGNDSWSKADSKSHAPPKQFLSNAKILSSKSQSPSPRHSSPNPKHSTATHCNSTVRSSISPKRTASTASPRESRRDQLTESFRRKMRTPDAIKERKSPARSIIRTPRKSEMAYFGPRTAASPRSTRRECDKVRTNKAEPIYATLEKPRTESPIYENLDELRHANEKKEFDSSILEELTKAADQILQAVNSYAQEDSNCQSSDDDEQKREQLETISETKSWKYSKQSNQKSTSVKKLKHTSSNSSLDSTTDRWKQSRAAPLDSDRKKKSGSDSSSARAATKARRLQRASSREALLQSHGSSSEDLPISVETAARKPRIIKKTKVTQLTITNVPEYSKRPLRNEKGKNEERVPVAALPEIRHKTAVSTIRSTAEKNRDRLRSKAADEQKKSTVKRLPVIANNSERIRSVTKKEPISHRIATAYVPAIKPRRRKSDINSCPCV